MSAALWVITLSRLPIAGVYLVVRFLLGYVYYRYRVNVTDTDGGSRYLKMVSLEDHEDAFAHADSYGEVMDGAGAGTRGAAPGDDR